MRHGKTVNQLGRTTSHRKAMLSNLASSLILHKRISTTVTKAKELRKYVEPLITKSKEKVQCTRYRPTRGTGFLDGGFPALGFSWWCDSCGWGKKIKKKKLKKKKEETKALAPINYLCAGHLGRGLLGRLWRPSSLRPLRK